MGGCCPCGTLLPRSVYACSLNKLQPASGIELPYSIISETVQY